MPHKRRVTLSIDRRPSSSDEEQDCFRTASQSREQYDEGGDGGKGDVAIPITYHQQQRTRTKSGSSISSKSLGNFQFPVPKTRTKFDRTSDSESDLETVKPPSVYDSENVVGPRLADVIDTLNNSGNDLRKSSLLRLTMKEHKAASLPTSTSRATDEEWTEGLANLSEDSKPPDQRRGLMDLVGNETRKRLSPLEGCLSTKTSRPSTISSDPPPMQPLRSDLRSVGSASSTNITTELSGMSKWKYPRNRSYIVDMNNPPDYDKCKSVSFEPLLPRRMSFTSSAPSISAPSDTPKVRAAEKVKNLEKPDEMESEMPPSASTDKMANQTEEKGGAKPKGRYFEDIAPCGNIYYPSSSPFRKQFQEQDSSMKNPKIPEKFLLLGFSLILVVFCLLFYFLLFGYVLSIHSLVNNIAEEIKKASDCLVNGVRFKNMVEGDSKDPPISGESN